MPTLVLASPAKLNLFLEVVGKRPDGYHDLESVFLEIDLADTLAARSVEDGHITLACSNAGVPHGDGNLVVRAATLLRRECGIRDGIHFELDKRIPMGGGLGGGSSNAAAALRLANRLWKTGLSDRELAAIGLQVGSDVPFFLQGGVCLCRGRGEVITPLESFPRDIKLGLALSGIHSATADAFRGLRLPGSGRAFTAEAFIRAMRAGDVEAMTKEAFNRFEETVFAALPALDALHRVLEKKLGHPVRMSGSGSGLWFFAEERNADASHPGVKLLKIRPRPEIREV